MDFRVLGPVSVEVAGAPISLGGQRQRSLLAVLLLARGRTVAVHSLVDALWGENPPATAEGSVQVAISRLRKAIGTDHITTAAGGYRLDIADNDLDLARFETHTAEGTQFAELGDLGPAVAAWQQALAEWRGQALSGVADTPSLRSQAIGLEEQRLTLVERLLTAQINQRQHPAALRTLEQLTQEHPYRESFHGLLMRALYLDGRQADALAVARRLRTSLSEDLGIDLSADLELLERDILNHAASLQPEQGADHVVGYRLPDSVPHPPAPLIGRERHLAEVERLLLDSSVRLVTFTGPGGVGKTRLAVELAHHARRTREVVYVPLDSLPTADLVMPTIAAVLQIKPSADEDLAGQIASVLRARDLLLVLDNFEHIIAAATEVSRLLALVGHGPQMLVTSRESLRISGEHLYPVGPLATTSRPHDATEPPPEDDLPSGTTPSAVELFCQRAEAASPEFNRDDSHQTVARICEQLDGLPLAIELAAARTNLLSPGRILERLTRRLTLLTTGTRDAPQRQRSLRACLEWSVDLLSEDERRVFGVASVFAGGATLASMEAVLSTALPAVDALTCIDSLVAKSLLRPATTPSGPRLTMLETIREYATELLPTSEPEHSPALAHAHHYYELLASDPSQLPWPPRDAEQLRAWFADLPNARVAMRTFEETGRTALRADLVCVLCRVWRIRGLYSEMGSELSALLERTELPATRRIDLLSWASHPAIWRGDLDAARRLMDEALHLSASSPEVNPVQEAQVHSNAEWVAYHRGEPEKASEHQRSADAAGLASEDPELIALVALHSLFTSTQHVADPESLLVTARRHGNQVLEVFLLINLSEWALAHEDPVLLARAEAWGRSGAELGLVLGNAETQAIGLSNAGAAALLLGRTDQAIADLRESTEAARRVGEVLIQVENLLRIAAARAAQGRHEDAAVLFLAWRDLRDRYGVIVTPANQRIIDTFLVEVAERSDDTTSQTATLSLSDAVEMAHRELIAPGTAPFVATEPNEAR